MQFSGIIYRERDFFINKPVTSTDPDINETNGKSTAAKAKKFVIKLLPGVGAVGAGITMIVTSKPESLTRMIGSDIVVTGLKGNVMRVVPYAKALPFSIPVLSVATLVGYLVDKTGISPAIFQGMGIKILTKTVKNLMKGQPILEALTENSPTRKDLKKFLPESVFNFVEKCLPKKNTTSIEEDDDDDEDDREWEIPSLKFRIGLITTLGVATGAAYTVPQLLNQPSTIVSMYLLNVLSKVATVGLRVIPIVPEIAIGAASIGAGYAIDSLFPNLPIKVFPPMAVFGANAIGDLLNQYVMGKLKNRHWIWFDCCNKSEAYEALETDLEMNRVETTGSMDITTEIVPTKKKEKNTPPPLWARISMVALGGIGLVAANLLVLRGESTVQAILPGAMNGIFVGLFAKGLIGKPDKKINIDDLIAAERSRLELEEKPDAEMDEEIKKFKKVTKKQLSEEQTDKTILRIRNSSLRTLFYGAAFAAGIVTDIATGGTTRLGSVAMNFDLKMMTAREAKEWLSYNYSALWGRFKSWTSGDVEEVIMV